MLRLCLSAALVCVTGLASPGQAQAIRITAFEKTVLEDGRVRVSVQAERDGKPEVPSFVVRLDEGPEGVTPPQFHRHANGYAFLKGDDFTGDDFLNLKDGGSRDEDARPGAFAVTLDPRDWPDGRYVLRVAAHNRPGDGRYISDRRMVVVPVGQVAQQEAPNAPDAEHIVVFKEEGVYACFPTLRETADGGLATTFGTRTNRSHINPAGGSATRVSGDGGRTWQPTEAAYPLLHWRAGEGRWVTAEAEGWVYVPASRRAELEAQNKVILDAREGEIAYLGGARAAESHDGGQTWQRRPIEVPDDVAGLMTFKKECSELVTSDGVRLVAVYGNRHAEGGRGHLPSEVFLLRSADDGATWAFVPLRPEGPGSGDVGFNETALGEAADGSLIAMMRTDPEGYLWSSRSTDGGLTWSTPRQTEVWGHPAHLLRLSDGRLLCSYGYRRSPMGVRAVVSSDHGETWDVEGGFILRSDGLGNPGDNGYPISRELRDGTIFTIYYITGEDGITQVAGTRWRAPAAAAHQH